jgi:hypothetical protein
VSLLDYAKQLLFEHCIAFEPDKVLTPLDAW